MKEYSIDGQKCIDDYVKDTQFIQKTTGWHSDEIHQLQAVLFKQFTYTQQQFITHIDHIFDEKYVKYLPNTVLAAIKNTILSDEFDIEELHYNIKNGKNVSDFGDKIVNMVEEWIQNKKNDHDDDKCAYFEDNFIKTIYEAVADCFIFHNKAKKQQNVSLDQPQDWTCHNCGNYNFNYCVGGQTNTDLSCCSLCGMQQIDSIILNLKNQDTFLMVNDTNDNSDMTESEQKEDAIDSMIYSVIKEHNFKLACPNKNHNKPCESILHLARNLVIHNKGNAKMIKLIRLDFIKSIDNEVFTKLFKESAKSIHRINKKQLTDITNILKDKNTINKDVFAELDKTKFIQLMRESIQLPTSVGRKLYNEILKKCSVTFTEFVSDYTQNVDRLYHHIFKIHIQEGNEDNIRNTFEFYKTVVHYNDLIVKKCASLKRREERANVMNSHTTDGKEKHKIKYINKSEAINVWELNQYYLHSQLDIIHAYLVHSNWNRELQKLSNIHKKIDENDEDDVSFSLQNTDKYITNLSEVDVGRNYKFGIDHSYLHLSPKHKNSSIRKELLCNKLCPISDKIFQTVLVKAIKKHKVALTEYKNELVCKYYHAKYNILR
eukprot:344729_1